MAVNLVGVIGDETEIFQVYMPDENYPYSDKKPVRVVDDFEEPNVDFHSLASFRWKAGWVFVLEGRQLEWLKKYRGAFPAGHVPYFDGVEVEV